MIGRRQAEKIRKKAEFLQNFQEFIIHCKNEIRFFQTPILQLPGCYPSNGTFGTCVGKCSKLCKSGVAFNKSWKHSFEKILKEMDFNEKIINLFIKFGDELGAGDVDIQMVLCEFLIKKIEPEINLLLNEYTLKIRLYTTLGSCAGAAAAIFLL